MTLTCKTCDADTDMLAGGECHECRQKTTAAWRKKMAIRQDPAQFDVDRIVRLLLTQHWMHECQIVPDYMPPYPGKDTKPTCQVRFVYESGDETFLRYSNGPLQGYFWDIYGDDMHSPEVALIAISQSPAPPRVSSVIPTHGS